MPEGPEIRLAADRIAAVLVGEEIVEAHFGLPALHRFERRLSGQTVTAVDTRGKAMLTRFDNGLTIYSHNQLYGRWQTVKRPKMPKTNRQLRIALHTATQSALLYSASDIEVLTDKQLLQHPFLCRIGPDILDPGLTPNKVAARLTDKVFRQRTLGSLYLDQSFLAGNGNYLRSEILWAARLDPRLRPVDLSTAEKRRVGQQTVTIARRSYRTRGVTAPDKQARARKAQGMRYQEYRFQVYGREGLECYRCGSTISKFPMASKPTHRSSTSKFRTSTTGRCP